jgi:hypothetical protein
MSKRATSSFVRSFLRNCRIAGAVALAAVAFAAAVPNVARAAEEGSNPPPVDTTTNPEALILNTKNPLAIHAGPGKPNVGSIYIPPSPSGKAKNAREGQTQKDTMGAEPDR